MITVLAMGGAAFSEDTIPGRFDASITMPAEDVDTGETIVFMPDTPAALPAGYADTSADTALEASGLPLFDVMFIVIFSVGELVGEDFPPGPVLPAKKANTRPAPLEIQRVSSQF